MRVWRLMVVSFCLALSTPACPAPAFAQSFDELRTRFDALRISSLPELHADAALNGRVVELQGEVTGVMARDGERVVLFKVGHEMAILAASSEMTNAELMRAGTMLRLLARYEQNGKNGDLIALAAELLPKTSAASKANSTPPIISDKASSDEAGGDEAIIVVPHTTTIDSLPPSPPPLSSVVPVARTVIAAKAAASKTSAPKASASKTTAIKPATNSIARLSAGELEEVIESQLPAYAAIVRRHNKKLKPEVVEEISIAILRAGYKYNMDPRFLAAIIAVESDFDVYCLSSSGAMGLGQLMPFNLREAGVKNAWNPTENIFGTAKLLRGHLNDYKNRPQSTLLAVAAYNAGPGAVRRAGYKVPKGKQVQRYVWKVYYRYKAFAPDMF